MRNSLIPIVVVILVAVAGFGLTTRGAARGSGGPEVMPGIFREVKRESRRVEAAPLTISASVGDLARRFPQARVVLIAGDDTAALTRALMLATAEEITRRGGLAVLDPVQTRTREPLPLGCDLRLALATTSGVPPATPAGSCAVTWRLTVTVPAPAMDLPAAVWLPEEASVAPQVCAVQVAAEGSAGDWPSWYAALSRPAAVALVGSLGLASDLGQDLATHVAAATWPPTGGVESTARLPQPPGADELRWLGAFQYPLVRGWVGRVAGATTTNRTGEVVPALQPLFARMLRGGWSAQRAADGAAVTLVDGSLMAGGSSIDPSVVAWIRDHEGIPTDLRLAHDGQGWLVTLWQVRPGAPAVVEQWRASASPELARHAAVVARLAR